MLSLFLAASFSFMRTDASLAYSCASQIVRECTPRDAGTARAEIAANKILDMAASAGADVRKDSFIAATGGLITFMRSLNIVQPRRGLLWFLISTLKRERQALAPTTALRQPGFSLGWRTRFPTGP